MKENVKLELLILFLMFIILGCLENFPMDKRAGSVRDVPEITVGFWEILKIFTTLLKNSWKVSAAFLSFEMIFLFSIGVILSLALILFEKRVVTLFQKFFVTCYELHIKIFKIRPF